MKVSVIIPTLNAERNIGALLENLVAQDGLAWGNGARTPGGKSSGDPAEVPLQSGEQGLSDWELELLVVDSSSQDATTGIVRSFAQRYPDCVKLLQIPREDFDHGGTRDFALRQTTGDYVLFLTQDALPADEHFVGNLLSAFSRLGVAAACGRHVAHPDAPAYESLTREFNYPAHGRVWRERDIVRYGVKAYFFSNACSAYRRDVYLAVGGFDAPVEANEDMLMAAKLLHAGYALAYEPSAVVLHSHDFTLRQDYERHKRIGAVMWRYRELLQGADVDTEGRRLVRFVVGALLRRGKIGATCLFLAHATAQFLGNRAGKRSARREEQ